MKKKALVLLSGGLDSTLAARWALEQENLEVESVHFTNPFCNCPGTHQTVEDTPSSKGRVSDIKTKHIYLGNDYLDMVKRPQHGYGSNMNPCIDCRIMMFQKASEYMKVSGAEYIITGEVLGERSMSQRRDTMGVIEKEAGLAGRVIRPLSGKKLPATQAELDGVISREDLLDIQGRSRKPQIKLAEEKGIRNYPTPAGGCLLTDPGFSVKLKDLFNHNPDCGLHDVNLLKVGRHLRIHSRLKVVVGRDEKENAKMIFLTRPGDHVAQVWDTLGAFIIARGTLAPRDEPVIAGIAAYYSKSRDLEHVPVAWRTIPDPEKRKIEASPLDREEIETYRIVQGAPSDAHSEAEPLGCNTPGSHSASAVPSSQSAC